MWQQRLVDDIDAAAAGPLADGSSGRTVHAGFRSKYCGQPPIQYMDLIPCSRRMFVRSQMVYKQTSQ